MIKIEKLTKAELIEKYKELQTEYEDLEQRYNDLDDCYAELETQAWGKPKEDIIADAECDMMGEFLWEIETNTCYQQDIFNEVVKCLEKSGVRFEILDKTAEAKDIKFADWMAEPIYRTIENCIEQFGRGLQRGISIKSNTIKKEHG